MSTAAELLAYRVSFFQGVKATCPSTEISVQEFLQDVAGGKWRAAVEQIRSASAAGEIARADKLKCVTLPAVTFSGLFQRRANDGLSRHSGLLCLDFDELGAAVADSRRKLQSDPHVLAVFLSPSGTGLKVLVPITATDNATNHACFKLAEAHFRQLGLVADSTGKDVARLCFASWDTACWIADGAREVIPFARAQSPETEPCTLHSAPCPLHTTLYTTGETEDERVLLARVRGEANRYLAQIEPTAPVLVSLYRQILIDRAGLGLHRRNDWLCEAVPFIFRAFSRGVGEELAMLHRRAHGGLYSGNETEHRASFASLWAGCEKNYPAGLSGVERGIYETLSEPESSAFRICRDLARLDNDLKFFLGCDHLASRLAPPGKVNGWRLLFTFRQLRIIELVELGRVWAKGHPAPASSYRWALPRPTTATEIGQH
jgi:hypothetical protein